MENPLRYIVLLAVILSGCLVSCETEPDIIDDNSPNKLFIWGYADMQNGKHQVKVREAIREDGNMYEMAQDPQLAMPKDSLLVELILKQSGNDIAVRMNPVVLPKEDGIFSADDNIIHEANYPISPGTTCIVRVTNLTTGEIIESEPESSETPAFIFPRPLDWFTTKYIFTNGGNTFRITFNTSDDLVQKWIAEIKYADYMENGDTVCQKVIFEGQPIFGSDAFSEYTRMFTLDYIFNIFNSLIPDNPDVKFRWFYRFNFQCHSASRSLRDYTELGQRFTDNRKLEFTNIKGGYGLFWTTDYNETGDIEPNSMFPGDLANSPETADLKFTRYLFPGTYIDPDDK